MKVLTSTLFLYFVGFLSFVQLLYGMEVGVPRPAEENSFTELRIYAKANQLLRLPNDATYTARQDGLIEITYANKRGPVTVEENRELHVVYPPLTDPGIVREDERASSSRRHSFSSKHPNWWKKLE